MPGNPNAKCPHCRAVLDGFTFAGQGDKTHAAEGDFTLCAYCKGPAVFRADLTLRAPTPRELELFERVAHAKANRELAERSKAVAALVDRVKRTQ